MAEPRRIRGGQRPPGSGPSDPPDSAPDVQPKQWDRGKSQRDLIEEVKAQLQSDVAQVHPPEELHIVIVRGGDMQFTAQHSNVEVIRAS